MAAIDAVKEQPKVADAAAPRDRVAAADLSTQQWQDMSKTLGRQTTEKSTTNGDVPQFLDVNATQLFSKEQLGLSGDKKKTDEIIVNPKKEENDKFVVSPDDYLRNQLYPDKRPMDENGKRYNEPGFVPKPVEKPVESATEQAEKGSRLPRPEAAPPDAGPRSRKEPGAEREKGAQQDIVLPPRDTRDFNLSTIHDGRLTEFSAINAKDQTRTSFEFDSKGRVKSRTISDLNFKEETVRFNSQGKPIAHEISEPGKKVRQLPIDKTDTVKTTYDSEGKLRTVESQHGEDSARYVFRDNQVMFKDTSEKLKPGQDPSGAARRDTRTEFDENGKAAETSTQLLTKDGIRISHERKSEKSLTFETFDKEGNIATREKTTPTYRSRSTYDKDGNSRTESIDSKGVFTVDDRKADGSSITNSTNLRDGSTYFEQRFADGSIIRKSDNAKEKSKYVEDGKTLMWGREVLDKQTGKITKSIGGPGMETQSKEEREI